MKNALRLCTNIVFTRNKPISLVHFVTHRCNARCRHCFIDFNRQDNGGNELTLAEIERFTQTLDRCLQNVNLTGGEPFLRDDIYDIVSTYIRNTAVPFINISSNGMFVSKIKEFLRRYQQSAYKTKIFINLSFDDFESEHDAGRRCEHLFANALASYQHIRAAGEKKIRVRAVITVTAHNYANVVRLYHHLQQRGIADFAVVLQRREGAVKKIVDFEKVIAAYESLSALVAKGYGKRTDTVFADCAVNARNKLLFSILPRVAGAGAHMCDCTAGSLFAVVYASGDVHSCEMRNDLLIGNLREQRMDFRHLWNSRQRRLAVKTIKRQRCRCTYECVWSVNVIANCKFLPQLLLNMRPGR